MPDKKFTALLTATVSPKGANPELRRTDSAVRLKDYETALRHWLTLDLPSLGGIVFAENSNASLVTLEAIAASENPRKLPVEFLSFDHPAPPVGLHYGYSEFKLIRAALERSTLLPERPFFIKATGRYIFPALPRLISKLPHSFRVAVDARCARPFSKNRNMLVQFALGIFEQKFFREFLWDIPERMTPAPPWTRAQFVENVLFDTLYPMRRENGVILRWPCNCEPVGTGANGDSYSSPRKRLQRGLRSITRRIAPMLWW
jgi:hypothetical protein